MTDAQDASTRTWLKFCLKLAIGIALLLACIHLIEFKKLEASFAAIDPLPLAIAFVLAVLGTIVTPALITHYAMQIERVRLPIGELIALNFATRFYVLVLPRPAALGIRWLRYKQAGSGQDAAALMLFERLVQMFIMLIVGAVLLYFQSKVLAHQALYAFAITAALALALGGALLPFLIPYSARWLSWLSRVIDRFTPSFISRRLNKLLDAVQAFHALPLSAHGAMIGLSFVAYGLFILSPFVVALAMGLDIGFLALAWIRPLVFVMTLLPLTIGGIGVREAGFIGLLHLYGVAHHEALAFSLVLFGLQVAIGLVGALAELRRVLRRKRLF